MLEVLAQVSSSGAGSAGDLSATTAALIGAGIAAVTAVVTAFLTHLWEKEREEKQDDAASDQAKAAGITAQLSGLYGPLRMLTSQSAALAKKLREGKPEPDSWHLLHHLKVVIENPADKAIVDQIIAINGDIEQRILQRAGLLKDGNVPDSFIAFLGHYRQLKIAFDAAVDAKEVPAEITAKQFESYPREFDRDVLSAYEDLRAERERLGV
jgi:hypothetical protein